MVTIGWLTCIESHSPEQALFDTYILKELIKSEYVDVQSFLSKIPDDQCAKNVATIKDLVVANATLKDIFGFIANWSKME